MRYHPFRYQFVQMKKIHALTAIFKDQLVSQTEYDCFICFWILSYEQRSHEQFKSAHSNAISVLVEKLRTCSREKSLRVGLATIKVYYYYYICIEFSWT